MKLKQAKRKLLAIRISLVLSIVLTVISITSFSLSWYFTNSLYSTLTDPMNASDVTQQKANYRKAISLIPTKAAAYSALLDIYSEDGLFSTSENEEFFLLYNGNRAKLRANTKEYTSLQVKIGLLYMNCFDSNGPTRLRMALPYFTAAYGKPKFIGDDLPLISCYCKIGKCFQDYIWTANAEDIRPEEVSDAVMSIHDTIDALVTNADRDSGFNSLGFCVSICCFLYDFREQLPGTVQLSEIELIMDWVYKTLPQISPLQNEQNLGLLTYLQDNETTFRTMIQWAYEEENE